MHDKRDNADVEAEFEDLANDFISEAEDVSCSPAQFKNGLETILDTLRIRLDQVKNELPEDDEPTDEEED